MAAWWVPVLSFLGALAGSGLGFWAAMRETTHRDTQARREEWGRRFTAALADVANDESFRRRELGRVVLVELARSELATGEEQRLADEVLLTDARLDLEGDAEILTGRAGIAVDDLVVLVTDDDEDET